MSMSRKDYVAVAKVIAEQADQFLQACGVSVDGGVRS